MVREKVRLHTAIRNIARQGEGDRKKQRKRERTQGVCRTTHTQYSSITYIDKYSSAENAFLRARAGFPVLAAGLPFYQRYGYTRL